MLPNEYDTAITIQTKPEAVRAILTDAAGYAAWNPEIVGISGRFDAHERFKARVKIGSGAIRSVSMRVTAFEAPTRMEWTGGLPFGLFVGRRIFTGTPHGNGAEFRMRLSMTGMLAPLILKSVGDRQPEIDSFTAALKAHAERHEGRSAGQS